MKKKKILRILFVIAIILINILIFWKIDYSDIDVKGISFVVELSADKDDTYQIYYSHAGDVFTEEHSESKDYTGYSKAGSSGKGKIQKLSFSFPMDFDNLRFDFGAKAGTTIIKDMYFEAENVRYQIEADQLKNEENAVDIQSREVVKLNDGGTGIVIVAGSNDPNMLIQFHKDQLLASYTAGTKNKTLILDIVLAVILDLIALYVLMHFFSLIDIPVEIYQNRRLAMNLAKNDFKQKYAGSFLGIVWAFIQPVVTVLVYWFVFTVGLKSGNVSGYPFVLYLIVGIVSWFFFSDALSGGTNALVEYNYLVKKVVFNIDILPFVKVMSALFVHCFFTVFAIILCICMGYIPSIYAIQIFYYIFCDVVFVLGLTYLTSAIVVFFKDLGQFINIFVIQVGVWLTPIMWNAEGMLSPLALKLFKLNPMYYIVSGFRDSLLKKQWFWQGDTLLWTIYFWMITVLVFGLGVKIFRRLKVHFADVM